MREILFRGKRESDGKWIYGAYSDEGFQDADFSCIAPLQGHLDDDDWAVFRETVSQFTGLADKNGNKIFEGDIVKIADHPFGYDGLYAVRYNEHMELCCGDLLLFRVIHWCEVIGNIHDNLELLESEG